MFSCTSEFTDIYQQLHIETHRMNCQTPNLSCVVKFVGFTIQGQIMNRDDFCIKLIALTRRT